MMTRHKVILGLIAGGATLCLIFAAPLRWRVASTYRSVFPEQNPERPVYDDTAKSPVDLAQFVQKARVAWPKADAGMVHQAAVEVAVGLLHHSDIEVGSRVGGAFVPWRITAWNAAEKIRNEMSAANGFLTEEGQYVFRRK